MKNISRKTFIQTTGLAATGMLITSGLMSQPNTLKIKALAFDAFAIFDPRPIFKTVEQLFPHNAKQLIDIWQSRQFTYQWLRILGNRYKNFWEVSKDALDYSLIQVGLDQHKKERDLIMANYEALQAWPDVIPALRELKKDNLKLCFLSNMTTKMLQQGIQNSNLLEFFDFVISSDDRQTFKPSPRAYEMAIEKLKFRKEEILFVPFAGWDMAGAKWFGYPTFWLNRLKATPEMLDAEPNGQGNNLDDILEFVRKYNQKN